MYQSIQTNDNACAMALISERKDILDGIAQLQSALKANDDELFEAINAYRPHEVIRNISNGKKYMVETRRILNCLDQKVSISYTIRPITKNGNLSQNTSHDQIDKDKIERTGTHIAEF